MSLTIPLLLIVNVGDHSEGDGVINGFSSAIAAGRAILGLATATPVKNNDPKHAAVTELNILGIGKLSIG